MTVEKKDSPQDGARYHRDQIQDLIKEHSPLSGQGMLRMSAQENFRLQITNTAFFNFPNGTIMVTLTLSDHM